MPGPTNVQTPGTGILARQMETGLRVLLRVLHPENAIIGECFYAAEHRLGRCVSREDFPKNSNSACGSEFGSIYKILYVFQIAYPICCGRLE
jgi:hypothetical protein